MFRKTGLSVGYVAGTQRKKAFGFDLYNVPKADHRYKILNLGSNNEKRKNFAQSAADAMKWVPGPLYMGAADWKKNFPGRRGKFLEKKRTTFTDEIQEYEKKLPGPNKYPKEDCLKKKERITGVYN